MADDLFKVKKGLKLKTNTTTMTEAGGVKYDGSGNLVLRDGSGEKTVLDQDNSVTVSNKTFTTNTIDADNNTISNIGDEELKAGIDAAKIADGSVSNTEFQYVNGVTSAIQTQLDSKATTTALNDHINDTTDAHAASAITNTPAGNLAATTVQAALDELQTDVDTRATSAALTSHTGASSGVHGVTGSVVGTTDTQDLSGKTFTDAITLEEQGSTPSNPSAGDKKFYAKNDGKLYTLDSGGNEIEVGSGSGGGGVLYINEDFETGVTNLVAYADAAGTSPVDGTGGAPTVSVNAETSSQLIGTTSARIRKDAANRQGEGAAIVSDTVDSAYSDKVHTVEFLWKTDANYTDGDMSLWVVHPTTGTVEALYFRNALGDYTNELPASSSSTLRVVSELTPIDSTYRIVLHVASTSATLYDVYVDNIQCGPQKTFNAPIQTKWESWDVNFDANLTLGNATVEAYYRRNGPDLEGIARITLGSTSSVGTNPRFTLPNGLTKDLSAILNQDNDSVVGIGEAVDTGTAGYRMWVHSAGTTDSLQLRVENSSGTYGAVSNIGSTTPFTWTTGDILNFKFSVPISGWDAGAVLSTTQVDVQTVKARAYRNTSTQSISTTSATKVQFNAESWDTHNAFDSTTNYRFTAANTNYHKVESTLYCDATTADDTMFIYIYVNGAEVRSNWLRHAGTDIRLSISDTVYLEKGDYVEIYVQSATDSSYTIQNGEGSSWVSIESLPDFSTFAVAQPSTSRKAVTSKTTTYTATIADEYILADTSGGAWTLTLPTAVGNTGKEFVIKKTSSDFTALTIDGNGSETIDGSTTTTLNTENETLKIVATGGNWEIVERRIPSEWTSFTPTGTWSTNTTYNGFWKREGDSILVKARALLSGAPNATALHIDLPSGLTFDTSKFTSSTEAETFSSIVKLFDNGTAAYNGIMRQLDSNTLLPIVQGAGLTYVNEAATVTNTAPFTFANNDEVVMEYKAAITGWKS